MARTTLRITFVLLAAVALYVTFFHCDWIVAGPHLAKAQSADEQPYVPHTPTGCPYGDSIPLDSPKCTPPNPVVYNQEQPAFAGK